MLLLMPILLLLLIVIVAIVILNFVNKHTKWNSRKSMFVKLGLYLLVLLISMGFVLVVPVDQDKTKNQTNELESVPSLINMAYDGMLYDGLNEYLVYQEEFSYQDDQLNIRPIIPGHQWFTIHVLVEKKDAEDSIIKASLYQTPSSFDEVDITEDIEPYQIKLGSDVMNITAEEPKLSYAFFKYEFPFNQFAKDHQPMFQEEFHAGEQLVYLRIPENMEIYVNDDVPIEIHYVNE